MKKYLQNNFQLDKPWVTDIIKEKFKKKEELYDKLKGRRDAKLFAEFKGTKNEFVKLYKEARAKFEADTLLKVNKFGSNGKMNYIINLIIIFQDNKTIPNDKQISRTE